MSTINVEKVHLLSLVWIVQLCPDHILVFFEINPFQFWHTLVVSRLINASIWDRFGTMCQFLHKFQLFLPQFWSKQKYINRKDKCKLKVHVKNDSKSKWINDRWMTHMSKKCYLLGSGLKDASTSFKFLLSSSEENDKSKFLSKTKFN